MKLRDTVVYPITFKVNDKKATKEIRVDLEVNQQGILSYKGYFIHEEHIKFEYTTDHTNIINDFMFKGKNPVNYINCDAEKAYCKYYEKEIKGVSLLKIELAYDRPRYIGMKLTYKYSKLYNSYSVDKEEYIGENKDTILIFRESRYLNPILESIKPYDLDNYIIEIKGGFIDLMLNPPPDNIIQVTIPRAVIEDGIFKNKYLFGVFGDYIYKRLNLERIDKIRDMCCGLPLEIKIGNVNTCELFIELDSSYEKVLVRCDIDKIYDYFNEDGRLEVNEKVISELINGVCGKKVSNYKTIVEELENKVKYLEENIDSVVKEKIGSLIK